MAVNKTTSRDAARRRAQLDLSPSDRQQPMALQDVQQPGDWHYLLKTLSAPASEAYCERDFSVCRHLSNGKRNRMSVNLKKRVFMKMNFNYLSKFDKL